MPAYNLELFGGRLHGDHAFALLWGAFPVLTGYFAQAETLAPAAFAAPARRTRSRSPSGGCRTRRAASAGRATAVEGRIVWRDGREEPLDTARLLAPHEAALRALAAGPCTVSLALLLTHWPRSRVTDRLRERCSRAETEAMA